MSDNYLLELNEVQKEAVINTDGPQLIIAGAGSGKTRVLTYKIVHLLNSGIKPSNILALTFTNKAAREMKERMATLTEKKLVNQIWMGTFHSIFSKILRIDGDFIGYPSNYTIYDAEDTKKQIREIIKYLKLDPEQYPVNEIYSRISKAKNNLVLPSAYQANIEIQKQDINLKRPETSKIYALYQQRCKKASAMDFDDLLLNTNILIRDFPEILEKYQNIFKYILVDEYQDTNYSQYLIIKKLSGLLQNICVVGDDSQSIYAFRGAKIENILNFRNDFPELKVYKLEKNYRSTKNIVYAANSLIEKNKNRIPKTIFTDNKIGEKVKVVEQLTDRAEAYYVAKKIIKIKKENNFTFYDFAILYRTNAQSRAFEDALRRFSIPYKIFGSISFYQRAEIKNIVAYLRLVINKNDDQALQRIINFPKRSIGGTTVDKLVALASSNNITTWDVILQTHKLGAVFNSRTIGLLNKFKNLIISLTEKAKELNAKEFVDFVLEKTGIKRSMAEDRSPEGISKFENIQEFTNAVQEYVDKKETEEQEKVSLENFLEEIALATDQDSDNADTEKVSMMTIHASKGLEFKAVFIGGVEEGLFPSFRSITDPKEIEEERRLFYVAITRSEAELFVTHTKQRMKWGRFQDANPSRFIFELDENYVDFEYINDDTSQDFENFSNNSTFAKINFIENESKQPKIDIHAPKKLKKIKSNPVLDTSESREKDDKTGIAVGMTVVHAKFGKGKVLKIEGVFPQTKATVDFGDAGQKNLLLKFAQLKIIES
ncbi:MAG: UvrD-helicase domain-containing protein [Bacteroidales bacterium]|nr:UvrD-helicase domain-containing protein [Bacteroidales bacterium]